ncbi:MAG: chromate transporter, partial [Bryobacteraceae bacterium]
LWDLGRAAINTSFLAGVCLAGVVLGLIGINEIAILFAAALVAGLARSLTDRNRSEPRETSLRAVLPVAVLMQAAGAASAAGALPFSLPLLFLFFLKVGSVLFGSGYVLLAFLRADLVERWHWLTETQLLDAIAIGQVTPGPVSTTATFIGYFLGGLPGAALATLGIFLPAFLFVAISGPLVPRIRRSPLAGAALDGVNAASLSLMGVVTYQLGRSALLDIFSVSIAAVCFLALVRYHVNPAWLVIASGALSLCVAKA